MSAREGDLAISVRISGRVQGVWFRGWAVEQARLRGIRGWVRNRSDGGVEALFIGVAANVDDILIACRRGPPAARVDKVEAVPAGDDGSVGFSQRATR